MWVSGGPYEDGQDAYVSGDYAMALRLLRPLAEQGHVDAQNLLGIMYREGRASGARAADRASEHVAAGYRRRT